MNSETKQLLQEAYALDDIARADFERDEHQQTKQRSGDNSGLVFKAYETKPMKQQVAGAMDAASAKAWNDWAINIARDMAASTFDVNIKKFSEDLIDAIAGFVAEREHKLRNKIIDVFAQILCEEVGKVRDEMRREVRKMRARAR